VGSDTIAERMRALGATPDGRSATVAAMTRLPAYRHGEQHTTTVVRLVFGNATAAVATMRAIHDAVDAADPSTSDLLHALIVGLETQMSMLAAQLEVMRALTRRPPVFWGRGELDSAPAEPVGAVPAQQRGVPWT
jgi:DNA-binding ferritin-like protein